MYPDDVKYQIFPEDKWDDLYYTCCVIESIGRRTKNKRLDVFLALGMDNIYHIFEYADVMHCEPMVNIENEYIEKCNITEGMFDNVADCEYDVPNYHSIAKKYTRLIIMIMERKELCLYDAMLSLLQSFVTDRLCDYNCSMYYVSPEEVYFYYDKGVVPLGI